MKQQLWRPLIAAMALVAVGVTGAQAAETSPHKGIFVGGGVMTGYETGPLNRFGGGAGARLGYGISDKVLVYLDNNYFYTRRSGVNFNFFDTQARLQFFPVGNWFAATGGGLAIGKASTTASTKAGFGMTTSIGYEFRPKEQMALSIESGYNFRRISGANFHSPVAVARLDWYF